ncbi:hypothetical protein SAMN04487911_10217 [Arenibacter nanhaiticus]|uniref:DUF1059 domain-containing protein n=1 Tax=Arenibacter nanhaiticus TaxID=558155 RepID=A0A1M6AZQ0_9FLAO|nr:DUF1059 domain-containing protein [Arenibacter nanhaiticus]SHI41984.1 hypothetical protein SAMN04487911_10217 [Arenibacter nanhaiticus]
MTCKELGGCCDKKLHADTFEEIAELSKQHGIEMFRLGDKKHLEAMKKMRKLMTTDEKMKTRLQLKKKAFDALPEVE